MPANQACCPHEKVWWSDRLLLVEWMNIHDWLKLLQQNWSWKAVHNIFFNSLPFSECQMHYRRPLAFWLSISYNLRSSAAHTASAICLLLNPFSLSPVALRLKYTERRCPGPRQFQAGILTKPWTRRSSMKTCRPRFFMFREKERENEWMQYAFFCWHPGNLEPVPASIEGK